MLKIALGIVTALLLAACADMGSTTQPAPAAGPTQSVGHPGADFPTGPRTY